MTIMDYKGIGLKVGLEFHQRLATNKLFCECESEYAEEEPKLEIVRRLRPVAGELGTVDPAAVQEFLREREFIYQITDRSTDLVELDEEPPHAVNPVALETALEIALLLNCDIFDEIHVMRKTVIDGSSVSGFQRTAIIGSNGFLETPYGKVEIPGVYLEEESAGIVGQKEGKPVYRLDRLCVPLVEIATGIMEFEPAQVKEVALKIGTMLRVTGKVQRGIGTIRQDVNVSIRGGERIEVKGVQEIRILDKIVENEVRRQQGLIKIKEELAKRGFKKAEDKPVDVTKLFENTACGFIKKAIQEKGIVMALPLRGLKGIPGTELCSGKRFGTELAERARSYGIGGLIHTDEDLSKYKIEKEVAEIRKQLKLSDKDAILIISDKKEKTEKAFQSIIERVNLAVHGVPKETRRALPDGNTDYMRPLPGAHRMYPETDLQPIVVTKEKLAALRSTLPAHPEQILEKLIKHYNLSEELAEQMVTSRYSKLFYKICDGMKVNSSIVANTLLNTLRSLSREGLDVSKISEKNFETLFAAVNEAKVSKEAIPVVLRAWAKDPKAELETIVRKEKLVAISDEEIRSAAKASIAANPTLLEDKERAFNVLMGELMKKYRGKADGGLIASILRSELG
jgi:glutamyl-tRNA(Gln) amidotransferase subunit E